MHVVLDGYVHRWDVEGETRHGTGWEQPVRIAISGIDGLLAALVLPAEISDGRLRVGAASYDNQ